ncbi:uncharacterized protein LOC131210583 [Anopheles bellator]|uniref:uncharacterized protein LOC131210583 n=1 Tax=Anopheles bellator TaxID=139047 RepID=UPI00264730AD|nr:uncharacterized protein LOC131210583 [Anopheles bellator]
MDNSRLFVEVNRNLRRNELKWDQKSQRKQELDRHRAGLGELHHATSMIENVTEADIKGLAGRIKRRKRCEPMDLVQLSYGFQQSRENISHFLRITGAINVIVKELTGHDYNLQLLAAECICNLSLGDDVCCEKIATFSGTYLITLVENSNCRPLQQTCMWILQNIVGSSPKGSQVLFSQGLVVALVRLLTTVTDQEAADEINLTLELSLNYGKETDNTLAQIVQSVKGKPFHPSTLRLLYKCLTSSEQPLPDECSISICHGCLDYLASVLGKCFQSQTASLLLCIRMLAHYVATNGSYARVIFDYLLQRKYLKFSTLFNECAVANLVPVCKELLWFLGQLQAADGTGELTNSYRAFDNFVEQLAIPNALL